MIVYITQKITALNVIPDEVHNFNLALLAGYDNYPAVGVFTEHPVSNIHKNRKLMVVNTEM